MKHYINEAGEVFGYLDDGSQDHFITQDMRLMTENEFMAYKESLNNIINIPSTCTPAQGLVALFALKSITKDDIYLAIETIADPISRYTARIGLESSTLWSRESATMAIVSGLLNLTNQDLNELFTYANTISI